MNILHIIKNNFSKNIEKIYIFIFILFYVSIIFSNYSYAIMPDKSFFQGNIKCRDGNAEYYFITLNEYVNIGLEHGRWSKGDDDAWFYTINNNGDSLAVKFEWEEGYIFPANLIVRGVDKGYNSAWRYNMDVCNDVLEHKLKAKEKIQRNGVLFYPYKRRIETTDWVVFNHSDYRGSKYEFSYDRNSIDRSNSHIIQLDLKALCTSDDSYDSISFLTINTDNNKIIKQSTKDITNAERSKKIKIETDKELSSFKKKVDDFNNFKKTTEYKKIDNEISEKIKSSNYEYVDASRVLPPSMRDFPQIKQPVEFSQDALPDTVEESLFKSIETLILQEKI